MPSGGDGFYYFSVYLMVPGGEDGIFNLELNEEELLCTVGIDKQDTTGDESQASCSVVTFLSAGLLQSYSKKNETMNIVQMLATS